MTVFGIIGNGVVGSATAKALADKGDVVVYDKEPSRSFNTLTQVLDADILFVCLPTPQHDTGSYGLCTKTLLAFFHAIRDSDRKIVLKSTVPIGTTKRFAKDCNLINLVHSPEFLTARTADHDAANPVRNIVGIPWKPAYSPAFNTLGVKANWLLEFYHQHWPHTPLICMNSDESEAVKLMQNSFSAVKIAFFNEIYQLCERMNLNWEVVREGILSSGWINEMHTLVPGPDGKYGFGGTCLPKDLSELMVTILSQGISAKVSYAAYMRNKEVDRR